jgi:hypothetical protein
MSIELRRTEETENIKGVYGKYCIEHADGSPIDPMAQYFVLRFDTDPAARIALKTYADAIEEDNPTLAGHIKYLVAIYS